MTAIAKGNARLTHQARITISFVKAKAIVSKPNRRSPSKADINAIEDHFDNPNSDPAKDATITYEAAPSANGQTNCSPSSPRSGEAHKSELATITIATSRDRPMANHFALLTFGLD